MSEEAPHHAGVVFNVAEKKGKSLGSTEAVRRRPLRWLLLPGPQRNCEKNIIC